MKNPCSWILVTTATALPIVLLGCQGEGKETVGPAETVVSKPTLKPRLAPGVGADKSVGEDALTQPAADNAAVLDDEERKQREGKPDGISYPASLPSLGNRVSDALLINNGFATKTLFSGRTLYSREMRVDEFEELFGVQLNEMSIPANPPPDRHQFHALFGDWYVYVETRSEWDPIAKEIKYVDIDDKATRVLVRIQKSRDETGK